MKEYDGGCHCGRFRVSFRTDKHLDRFIPRLCGCSFCTRHGSAAISDPAGALALDIPETALPYRFGLKITDFHVCDRCGVFVGATWRAEAGLYGVVNIHCLEARESFLTAIQPAQFVDEDRQAREERRQAVWTPACLNHHAG